MYWWINYVQCTFWPFLVKFIEWICGMFAGIVWWIVGRFWRRECGRYRSAPYSRRFDVTLFYLRQLMTPFHENSDNFYGDVGQVKVAVRLDSTSAECDRLQQLGQQVRSLKFFACSWLVVFSILYKATLPNDSTSNLPRGWNSCFFSGIFRIFSTFISNHLVNWFAMLFFFIW